MANRTSRAPSPRDPFEDFGRGFVEAVDHMREQLVKLRERIAAEPGRDATAAAGFMARAILEAGGSLPDSNPAALRWAINESPSPAQDPGGHFGTKLLVGIVLEALKHGPRDNGTLAVAAAAWPDAKTKPDGDAAAAVLRAREGEAIAAKHRAAHEERLTKLSQDPHAAARVRQSKADEHEKDHRRELELRAKREKAGRPAEGEWVEGDGPDVAGDVAGLSGVG